jgi:hypothetical protein
MLLVGVFLALMGLLVSIIGIIIWKKQKFTWVSMHSNLKKNDIEAFTKNVGQSTIGIGFSVLFMGIFFALNLMIVGFIAFAVFFIASFNIYLMAQSKYNGTEPVHSRKNSSKGQGKLKNSNTRIIVFCISTAIIFAIIIVSIINSGRPPVFTVGGGILKISTDFGETVNLSDIQEVELKPNLPDNLIKTDGLGLESVLKGEFQSGGEEMKVYVDASKPPFIYINTTNGLIIINDQTKAETQALYNELESDK